jgi:hypothetical protein
MEPAYVNDESAVSGRFVANPGKWASAPTGKHSAVEPVHDMTGRALTPEQVSDMAFSQPLIASSRRRGG